MTDTPKESRPFEAMPEAWFARLVRARERDCEAGVQSARKELARLGFHVCLIETGGQNDKPARREAVQ